MNLDPLCDFLQDKGLGTPGMDLFVNMMPPECKKGILLRQSLTGTRIDYYLPGFYKTNIQLIVRTHDYLEGESLIKKAINAVTIKSNTQIGSMLIRYLRPTTKPVSFPLSMGNFFEFTVRLDACYNEVE